VDYVEVGSGTLLAAPVGMADQHERKTTTPELEQLRKAQSGKKQAAVDPTHILDKAIYHLWETINDLDQIQPERVEHYRVSIFGSSRVRRGDPIYEEVKKLSYDLAHMGVDIVTGGGPGLMEAANACTTSSASPRHSSSCRAGSVPRWSSSWSGSSCRSST